MTRKPAPGVRVRISSNDRYNKKQGTVFEVNGEKIKVKLDRYGMQEFHVEEVIRL